MIFSQLANGLERQTAQLRREVDKLRVVELVVQQPSGVVRPTEEDTPPLLSQVRLPLRVLSRLDAAGAVIERDSEIDTNEIQ